jgi:hypothetical protein
MSPDKHLKTKLYLDQMRRSRINKDTAAKKARANFHKVVN